MWNNRAIKQKCLAFLALCLLLQPAGMYSVPAAQPDLEAPMTAMLLGGALMGTLFVMAVGLYFVVEDTPSWISAWFEKRTQAREQALAVNPEGGTDLMHYAYAGNIEKVKSTLAAGARIDAQHNQGYTALYYAAQEGHTETVRLLLNAHANPDLQNQHSSTPLYAAVEKNHSACVKVLCDYNADTTKAHNSGDIPLHTACYFNGNIEIVKTLIAKNPSTLHTKNMNGRTPLSFACQAGYIDIVKLLVERGALVNEPDNTQKTPLMYAAENGRRNIVHHLLDNFAQLNATDSTGMSALLYAKNNNHYAIEKDLALRYGADFKSTAPYRRDLQDSNAPEIELVDHGMQYDDNLVGYEDGKLIYKDQIYKDQNDAETVIDGAGRTALMQAAYDGNMPEVQRFVASGTNINKQCDRGFTALYHAVDGDKKDVVAYLIAHQADVNLPSKILRTPLMHARSKQPPSSEWILQSLLEARADITQAPNSVIEDVSLTDNQLLPGDAATAPHAQGNPQLKDLDDLLHNS